jgi:hypothetical protein
MVWCRCWGWEDGPGGKGEGCRNVVVVDDEMEAPSPHRPYRNP